MSTHLSIFKGCAGQLEVKTSAPTDREQAEYKVAGKAGLQDGDWYFNSTTGTLGIYIGTTWNYIEFSPK